MHIVLNTQDAERLLASFFEAELWFVGYRLNLPDTVRVEIVNAPPPGPIPPPPPAPGPIPPPPY